MRRQFLSAGFLFLYMGQPQRSPPLYSSARSDLYKRQDRLAPHDDPPGAEAGGPAPDPDEPATTAGGLARRVPGANLASLRRNDPPEAPPAAPAAGTPGRDPERTRTMLSRFQASQRAGRLVAGTPGSAPPPPPTDRSEQEHP
nr:hypothetical protein [Thermoanaerobacterales bacterium]